jgi:hypothetical protein
MATRAQIIKRCKELNVTLSDNGYGYIIECPDGYVFKTYGTDSEFMTPYDGWNAPQIYDEFLFIMKDGIELGESSED